MRDSQTTSTHPRRPSMVELREKLREITKIFAYAHPLL